MARRTALALELDRYRKEHGDLDWEATGKLLGTAGPVLRNMAARGYCTPRIARRIEKASRGRLPAWLLLGLDGPPPRRTPGGESKAAA
jgi:hypothetical protein